MIRFLYEDVWNIKCLFVVLQVKKPEEYLPNGGTPFIKKKNKEDMKEFCFGLSFYRKEPKIPPTYEKGLTNALHPLFGLKYPTYILPQKYPSN